MTTAFLFDKAGEPYIYADPDSDLDYSLTSWIEGQPFSLVTWSISPSSGVSLHNQTLNGAPVTIDGKTYDINYVATLWITGMVAGTYKVTCHATFAGGQVDDRTFTIQCKDR